MSISKDFYALQNEWLSVYTRPLNDHDRKRTKCLGEAGKEGPLDLLEIGCGGGQFAAACAELGHRVTAIDIVPAFIEYAKKAVPVKMRSHLNYHEADFYSYEPGKRFDLICYLDGFGVGTDEEQIQLLNNMASWLKADGAILLEVYTPWYWAKTAYQKEGKLGNIHRIYDYDPIENRMVDTWWLPDKPEDKIAQRLRCYAPADLDLLLKQAGLERVMLFPQGAVDYESMAYHEEVDLIDAMSYITLIQHR